MAAFSSQRDGRGDLSPELAIGFLNLHTNNSGRLNVRAWQTQRAAPPGKYFLFHLWKISADLYN
jgi:hypothetical protein